jgi:acyl-coenzyme A synthetase/AMP-(fatty) acid ligase
MARRISPPGFFFTGQRLPKTISGKIRRVQIRAEDSGKPAGDIPPE